jgi:hypothetical protein
MSVTLMLLTNVVESRTTTVYIAHSIGMDPIRKPNGAVSKEPSIL